MRNRFQNILPWLLMAALLLPSATQLDRVWEGSLTLKGSKGLVLKEIAAPGAAASGYAEVYAKNDGLIYGKDDAGTETKLSNASGSPLTTKGDLYTYSVADARLPVGADGLYLMADSIQATGLKWTNLLRTTEAANPLGYDTGAGSTVAQAPAKTSAVTINANCGTITMAAVGAINTGAEVSFTVNNTAVTAEDRIIVNIVGGGTAGAYCPWVSTVGAGSFNITVSNVTGGNLTEAPVIGFMVLNGTTS